MLNVDECTYSRWVDIPEYYKPLLINELVQVAEAIEELAEEL